MGLEALGLAKRVRRALSAAKIKASAFMGESLAPLLCLSNKISCFLVIFFADWSYLWCNSNNFHNGG
jgi:hypothetical protein